MRQVRQVFGLIIPIAALLALGACRDGGYTSSASNNTPPPPTSSNPPPPPASTGSVTLSWTLPTLNTDGTALTNLAGFKVIYGQSQDSLTQLVTINNPTVDSYQIDNLTPGTWYFAVVSVSSDGTESSPTNLLSQTI